MIHTALYAALCGVALVALSLRVIRLRRRLGVSVGHGGAPDLERAMRVQANFTEYVPLTLILLALAEQLGLAPLAIHALGLLLLAGRAAHFLGFRSTAAPGSLRVGGMALTFTTLLLLAGIVAVQVVMAAPGLLDLPGPR